jgi:hypothetical protein
MEKQFVIMSKAELRSALTEIFESVPTPATHNWVAEEKMDRRKTSEFLAVSYQTVHNWVKAGAIKEHGIGRKKFYLRSELIEAMKKYR